MKIILASKSGVRKEILDKYNIENEVIISNENSKLLVKDASEAGLKIESFSSVSTLDVFHKKN